MLTSGETSEVRSLTARRTQIVHVVKAHEHLSAKEQCSMNSRLGIYYLESYPFLSPR